MKEIDKKVERLRGLFEGGNFPNSQINVITGDGVHVSYQSTQNKTSDVRQVGVKKALMEYIERLMPVVTTEYQTKYIQIWSEILEQENVGKVIYNPGSQKGTVFNRNLVARISHMMVLDGIITPNTSNLRMSELLEPEKGKDHSIRGELGMSPNDKMVKKAVKEVLKKHRM